MENNEIYENIGNMIKIQKEFQKEIKDSFKKERELFLERVENLTENDYISIGKLSAITSLMEKNLDNDGKSVPINGFGKEGYYTVLLSVEAFKTLTTVDKIFKDYVYLNFSNVMEPQNHFGEGLIHKYRNLKLIQVPTKYAGVNKNGINYQIATIIGDGGSFDYPFTIL